MGSDVVLQQDGDAVEAAPHLPGLPVPVPGFGDVQGIGIHLDDAPESGPGPIHFLNAVQVELGDPTGGPATAHHAGVELGDGDLFQLEGGEGPGLAGSRTTPSGCDLGPIPSWIRRCATFGANQDEAAPGGCRGAKELTSGQR